MMARKMKDSGIPWIGEIPEEWKVARIKSALKWISLKNHGKERVLSLYRDLGVVFKDERDDNHNVTSEKTDDYKFVEVGDFVINKMKAWQGSMAVSPYQGIVSPAYYVAKFTNEKIFKPYFHYLMRDKSYTPEYLRLSTGLRVGQWDLQWDDFCNIKFLIPPYSEQQKISSYLDNKCLEIDELIEVEQKMINELESYRKAIITESVTNGLNKEAPMRKTNILWTPKIPEHWEEIRLKFLTSKIGSGVTPRGGSAVYQKEGIPLLRSQNILFDKIDLTDVAYISDEIDREMSGSRVQDGDVLLNITGGSIGRVNYIPQAFGRGNVNQHVCILRPKGICTKMLYYILYSELGQRQVKFGITGGNREGLTSGAIKEFEICLPPLEEQQAIADYLDTKCKEIDDLIAVKREKIETLKQYRQSLIFEAVTGKIQLN